MLNTCFPGTLVLDRQRCLHDQPAVKPLGAVSLMGFCAETSHTCCYVFTAVGWGALYNSSREEEGCTWIPPNTACLSPYDLAVYPYYIAIINLSHKYNCMLRPVSFTKSPNVEVISETLNSRKCERCLLSTVSSTQGTSQLSTTLEDVWVEMGDVRKETEK